VDDKETGCNTLEHTIPLRMTVDETLDVGVETRSGVDDRHELL
jgi:hypothetical protein